MRFTKSAIAVLLTGLLYVTPVAAQQFIRLQTDITSDTISSNGDSVVLSSQDLGAFGSVKVQTLDSYSGTWAVQCASDGANYSTSYPLKMTAANDSTAVTSVTDTIGIWDVVNAGGCKKIRVIATAGFAATDTVVVISATQTGGGAGGGSASGGGAVTNAGTFAVQVTTNTLAADAAIASKQPALGTFGTGSADVISIQGGAAMSPVEVNLTDASGTPLVLAGDAVHDSAAATSGPQLIGECDDVSTDAVDEGDAAKLRVDCSSRALIQTPVGNSSKRYLSAGSTEDESEVKATAGVLLGIAARNSHATTIAYLKCTNATAANTTPGSTAIVYEMIVPAAGGFVDRNINQTFSTALTCYIVTGKTDADATEVAAGDVSYNMTYR